MRPHVGHISTQNRIDDVISFAVIGEYRSIGELCEIMCAHWSDTSENELRSGARTKGFKEHIFSTYGEFWVFFRTNCLTRLLTQTLVNVTPGLV